MRKQSWWKSNVNTWSFVSSENDYVLNRLGEWSQERYRKHQPVEVGVEVKTDQTNQSIKPMINWLRPTNQATKVKQFIQERSDCNKASNSSKSGRIATNWPNDWTNTSTSTSTPLEVGVGQRSGSEARGVEPARGQEPTAEALKI